MRRPNEVRCPNLACNRVERVDRDEDGFADMELVRCHVDGCEHDMCMACKTVCFGCDCPSCDEHLTELGEEKYCPCCFAEIADEARQELMEAV
jgi:hypothetical protein